MVFWQELLDTFVPRLYNPSNHRGSLGNNAMHIVKDSASIIQTGGIKL
jgi:hypothetical protein